MVLGESERGRGEDLGSGVWLGVTYGGVVTSSAGRI